MDEKSLEHSADPQRVSRKILQAFGLGKYSVNGKSVRSRFLFHTSHAAESMMRCDGEGVDYSFLLNHQNIRILPRHYRAP